MENVLPTSRAIALNHGEPVRVKSLLQALCNAEGASRSGSELILANIEDIGRVDTRHNEGVAFRGWRDVEEGDHILIRVEDLIRWVASHDVAKNTFNVFELGGWCSHSSMHIELIQQREDVPHSNAADDPDQRAAGFWSDDVEPVAGISRTSGRNGDSRTGH